MRSSRHERGRAADRKEIILRAAIETFAQRGFSHASMAHIARAAGVGSGTLYLHFRGKDQLLVSIFDRVMVEAIAEGKEALKSIPDPVGRLDEIARLHLRRMGQDRQLAIVFQVELRQSVKFMEQFSSTRVREYLGIIREVIAAGQAGAVFRDGLKPTIAAKMFFGILDQMATNWVLSPRPYPLEAEAALVVDLFVNGMAARDGRASGRGRETMGAPPDPFRLHRPARKAES